MRRVKVEIVNMIKFEIVEIISSIYFLSGREDALKVMSMDVPIFDQISRSVLGNDPSSSRMR